MATALGGLAQAQIGGGQSNGRGDLELDCNGNQIEDALDIKNGTSEDLNENGVPDECESSQALSPPTHAAPRVIGRVRHIEFVPGDGLTTFDQLVLIEETLVLAQGELTLVRRMEVFDNPYLGTGAFAPAG